MRRKEGKKKKKWEKLRGNAKKNCTPFEKNLKPKKKKIQEEKFGFKANFFLNLKKLWEREIKRFVN